jgi:hypothetical protein
MPESGQAPTAATERFSSKMLDFAAFTPDLPSFQQHGVL